METLGIVMFVVAVVGMLGLIAACVLAEWGGRKAKQSGEPYYLYEGRKWAIRCEYEPNSKEGNRPYSVSFCRHPAM
jgi:hypothetical protein